MPASVRAQYGPVVKALVDAVEEERVLVEVAGEESLLEGDGPLR